MDFATREAMRNAQDVLRSWDSLDEALDYAVDAGVLGRSRAPGVRASLGVEHEAYFGHEWRGRVLLVPFAGLRGRLSFVHECCGEVADWSLSATSAVG